MNDLNDSMKTIQFTQHSMLTCGKYLMLDDMLTDYLNEVRNSDVDAFSNLVERDCYNNASMCLKMLFILELIGAQEYERVATLFDNAVSAAHQRHQRLVKALERRERMRSSVKAQRMGARG